MGIKGLLPLLKSIHEPVHLSQFSGHTLAIDGYGWLHKGAFGCAFDLATGRPTTRYVDFCMQRIEMMRKFGVNPYVVFDGGPLPMKAGTEDDRLKRRTESLAKGNELLKSGNRSKAMEYFQQCVDITPEMALEFIKALRERNISYVVAPYEADAQLAFLEQQGIVDGVITEDTDLLVFGCRKCLYKLDNNGNAVLIRLIENLTSVTDLQMRDWTLNDFRRMCILSGCDYLKNIAGIGLKTAHKLLKRCKTIEKLIRTVRLDNMALVPSDYSERFRIAELTFLHQKIFDVREKRVRPLIPFEASSIESSELEQISYSMGPDIDDATAQLIASGEMDPITRRRLIDFSKTDESKPAGPVIDRVPHLNILLAAQREEKENIIVAGPSEEAIQHAHRQASVVLETINNNDWNGSRATWQSKPSVKKPTTMRGKTRAPDPRQTSILSFLTRRMKPAVESRPTINISDSTTIVAESKSENSSNIVAAGVFKTIQVSRFFKESLIQSTAPRQPAANSSATLKFGQNIRHRFNRMLPRRTDSSSSAISADDRSPEKKRQRNEFS